MLTWPDRAAVDVALRHWLAGEFPAHPDLRRFGYFGSYARGTWGVGSDLDLVAIVDDRRAGPAFDARAIGWRVERLPVPADLLVYTESEWRAMVAEHRAFASAVERDAVWIYQRQPEGREA